MGSRGVDPHPSKDGVSSSKGPSSNGAAIDATTRTKASKAADSSSTKTSNEKKSSPSTQSSGKVSKTKASSTRKTSMWVYAIVGVFVLVTVMACPVPLQLQAGEEPTLRHVFFYGWMTAISTGVGVLPFVFISDVASYWVGISNAVAAGMMIAASYSLFIEGCAYADPHDETTTLSTEVRTGLGAVLGLIFLLGTKKFLDQYEDLKLAGLGGTDARKALLIFFVMTVHSFSEGVGVGVSFGGMHGCQLGTFISASLAVHNVPEGLAMAVVLLPRGVTLWTAVVWAISTSLPQPLMAVPAYLFVHTFIPVLPVGLGFAGGAMAWVAFFELLTEAIEDTNLVTTVFVSSASLISMITIQAALDDESRMNLTSA